MRFWLGHRLPGGFWGGIGLGGYGGYRRPPMRPRRGNRRIRATPSIVVHMTGAEYAAHQKQQREEQARGCAVLFWFVVVCLVGSLIVEYWYIAVPVLAVVGFLALLGFVGQRKARRSAAAPPDAEG